MVVPVDADIEEAEQVHQQGGYHGFERLEATAVGHFELQHHDGDDDGDHAVTECLESTFVHECLDVILIASVPDEALGGSIDTCPRVSLTCCGRRRVARLSGRELFSYRKTRRVRLQ